MSNENSSEKQISERTIPLKEKLSVVEDETKNSIEHLRGIKKLHSSEEREAQVVQEKIGEILRSEKKELIALAGQNNNPLVQALMETREKEIEKELIDNEIDWLEKQIWDLYVDTSPEKTKLENAITWIKRGDLILAITDCVSALREEKLLLTETDINEDGAKRLHYIDKQIKKLEIEFNEIQKPEE